MSDLPLLFHLPPGWPTPSEEWVASHLGWTPPAGWRPGPRAPQAPANWTFWTRNPAVWSDLTRPARARVTTWLWISIGAGLLGLLLTIAGAGAGGSYTVFWGAVLWPLINLVRYPFRLRDIDQALTAHVTETSRALRQHIEDAMYEEHVRSSSR